MVARRGFEPRFPDSESGVLPDRRTGNNVWLGRVDSNHRPADSKSVILPLNYFPTYLVLTVGYDPTLLSPQLSVLPLSLHQDILGVPGETRTHVVAD